MEVDQMHEINRQRLREKKHAMLTSSQIEENATGMNISADVIENAYK